MFSVLVNLLVLMLGTLFSWWLSGYDPGLTIDSERKNFIRRAVRCAITFGLLEFLFQESWQFANYHDQSAVSFAIFTLFLLAFVWCGCLSNCVARGFVTLIDPEDKRKFDPQKELRELDLIGGFIRSGNKTAAIELCESLKTSGEVDLATLEFALEHLGVPQAGKPIRPLVAASRLRLEGKFHEAELILSSMLAGNPRDLEAAMMLVRLYAQDLRQPEKAKEVLRALEKQPRISSAHIEFADRSIPEWSQLPPGAVEVVEPPKIESIDELLAQGFFGTATERLEAKIKEQPQDFESRLKIAEVYGVHCANFPRAEKIVRQIEKDFSPKQVQLAKMKLAEWREMQPRH
ncbi:MAG TPA: tetratricopeptide repeat protein [Verrucomicrobiae bacterium]|jgi:hypothetical protein